jgi:hypothetical protein
MGSLKEIQRSVKEIESSIWVNYCLQSPLLAHGFHVDTD